MEQALKWENSFKVNPIRPREAEVHDQLEMLLSKKGVVKRAHLVSPVNTVFVQISSKKEAEEIVEQHRGKHGKTIDGVCYPIAMLMNNSIQNPKV